MTSHSWVVIAIVGACATADAQPAADPSAPPTPGYTTTGAPPADQQPKQPKRGDFDAGGQLRLPNGPDDTGHYATYNWIDVDLKGRYYLLDSVTVDGLIPLAVRHPDMLANGEDPKMIGGFAARFDAKLPKPQRLPGTSYDTELGLSLTLAYMHQGAMLLSDKDYPLFIGNFEPGFAAGPIMKIKLSSVVDFSLVPAFVLQAAPGGSQKAVQIPTSLSLKLGSLVQVAADVGMYTGADYSFSGNGGGRLATGGSLTVKLGPIVVHAGAGLASLLTGGLYPTIGDSVYLDLNVKYAK